MKEALIELFPFKHGMNWMAVDPDGGVYQYSNEPVQNTDPEEWYEDSFERVGFVSPPQDWTTTLVKREEWKLSESQITELCQIATDNFIYNHNSQKYGTMTPEGITEIINMYESFKPKA